MLLKLDRDCIYTTEEEARREAKDVLIRWFRARGLPGCRQSGGSSLSRVERHRVTPADALLGALRLAK